MEYKSTLSLTAYPKIGSVRLESLVSKVKDAEVDEEKDKYQKSLMINWISSKYKFCCDFFTKDKQESYLVIRFTERYSLVPSSSEKIGCQHMYDIFVKFCKKEGEIPTKKDILNNELRKLNFKKDERV